MRRLAVLLALLMLAGCGGVTYTPLTREDAARNFRNETGCFNAINCSSSHDS